MILYKKNSMDYQSLKTHSFVIAKLKVCSFPILGPEKCTYRGIESDKYTTLSAINTFLLLNMQQQHHRQHLFSKMAICIHENRFKECTTVKLSILYKWVSCPSAFLLLSLFETFLIIGVKKCIIKPLSFLQVWATMLMLQHSDMHRQFIMFSYNG